MSDLHSLMDSFKSISDHLDNLQNGSSFGNNDMGIMDSSNNDFPDISYPQYDHDYPPYDDLLPHFNYSSHHGYDFDYSGGFNLSMINDFNLTVDEEVLENLNKIVNEIKSLYENPVSPWLFWSLVMVYSTFIIVGLFGNLLIVWAVLGRENMRTARNVFIVTLAISDLVLCTFTMPSTLWEVLYRRWPFGPETQWLCKLTNAGQATPVFMSSLSIVAIAVDRYRCIIQPDLQQLTVRASVFVSVAMVTLSSIMSVPLFIGTELTQYINFTSTSMDDTLVCFDDRSGAYRTVYNLISTFVQFILPLLIVFCVYLSIFCRLRDRPQSQHSENNRRRRRTNIMIILISISFFLSWLPLNVVNILLDFSPDFMSSHLNGQDALVYGICNILGLSNACINPVLYGYFNENFRKEYKSMLAIPWRRLSSIRGGGRHHHHHRRRHCRFELLNVGTGGEGGVVVDNGDGDLEEGGGAGGIRGDNSSHAYNSFSSQVLMGGLYRHSSQENSTTMSAPAALVNSTGVMLHMVSPPKRLMLASCRCPKHSKVSKSKRRLVRWGNFLAKWKRTAFFRKICDIEEKEEMGGPREDAQHAEQNSTTLRWAPMRQVRYVNGIGGDSSSSDRPSAPPKGHAREKEWERRKRQRRMERKAASLSSLAHPRNYRRATHVYGAAGKGNRRFVQVRFTEEKEGMEPLVNYKGRRRQRLLSLQANQPSSNGSSQGSLGSNNAASLVKVRFKNIPKYSVSLEESKKEKKQANGHLPSDKSSKKDAEDVEAGNMSLAEEEEEEEEELLVVTTRHREGGEEKIENTDTA